jgi:hypothetical protein
MDSPAETARISPSGDISRAVTISQGLYLISANWLKALILEDVMGNNCETVTDSDNESVVGCSVGNNRESPSGKGVPIISGTAVEPDSGSAKEGNVVTIDGSTFSRCCCVCAGISSSAWDVEIVEVWSGSNDPGNRVGVPAAHEDKINANKIKKRLNPLKV